MKLKLPENYYSQLKVRIDLLFLTPNVREGLISRWEKANTDKKMLALNKSLVSREFTANRGKKYIRSAQKRANLMVK